MPKSTRHKAFSILSQILWERKFIKKRKHYAVVSGGRMTNEDFERCIEALNDNKK